MLVWIQKLTHLVAPPVCLLCRGDGQQHDEPWGLDLCEWCEAACESPPTGCARCGEPGQTVTACRSCHSQTPPYDSLFCLFRYQDPVDLLVTGLKFRHNLAAARVLGMLFARRYLQSRRPLPQCVIPMPLHIARLRDRGFNQCMEIARHLTPRLGKATGGKLPIRTDILQRQRATLPQSELSGAERAANLAGAFCVPNGIRPPGHVALLDDVLTTGHTAAAAATALKAAGCHNVEIWACARALRRGQSAPIW